MITYGCRRHVARVLWLRNDLLRFSNSAHARDRETDIAYFQSNRITTASAAAKSGSFSRKRPAFSGILTAKGVCIDMSLPPTLGLPHNPIDPVFQPNLRCLLHLRSDPLRFQCRVWLNADARWRVLKADEGEGEKALAPGGCPVGGHLVVSRALVAATRKESIVDKPRVAIVHRDHVPGTPAE
jgi:hypothetical protein